MLIHPRVAIASGLAAAAGATFLILGRVDGSVLLAAALAVGVRAGALAASPEPAASGALARQVAVAPVWAALAVVAGLRAGSIDLEGVRGAHAVAGIGLLNGEPLMVAAMWATGLAGVVALLAPSDRGALLLAGSPAGRLEALGLGVQALLLVAILAGPQVVSATDVIPWVVVGAVLAAGVAAGRSLRRDPRLGALSVGLAVFAVVLAIAGEAP